MFMAISHEIIAMIATTSVSMLHDQTVVNLWEDLAPLWLPRDLGYGRALPLHARVLEAGFLHGCDCLGLLPHVAEPDSIESWEDLAPSRLFHDLGRSGALHPHVRVLGAVAQVALRLQAC